MPSRRLAPLVTVVAVVLFVLGGPARPAAAACTCSPTTPTQGMQDSAIVFVGSLADITPSGDGLIDLHFDVRLAFKGDVGATADVTSFASAEDCGVGTNARRGDWLVFAYDLPGGTGKPLLSTCSPSMPLVSGADLPVALGAGRVPEGVVQDAGPVVTTPDFVVGTVPDPYAGLRVAGEVVAVLAGIGLVARLLAGRRRFVVR